MEASSKRTASLHLTGMQTEKRAPFLSVAQQDHGRVVAGFIFRAPWTQKQVSFFEEENQKRKAPAAEGGKESFLCTELFIVYMHV